MDFTLSEDVSISECGVPCAVAAYGCRSPEDELSSRILIGYVVSSVVRSPTGELSTWAVCKRYSDFRVFHATITTLIEHNNLTPDAPLMLPKRHFFFSTNQSKSMVESRRQGLDVFMQGVHTLGAQCTIVKDELRKFVSFSPLEDIVISLRCSETKPGAPSAFIHSTFIAPESIRMENLIVKLPWGVLDYKTNEICIKSTRSGPVACARRYAFLAICEHIKRQSDRMPSNREVWQLSAALARFTHGDVVGRRRASSDYGTPQARYRHHSNAPLLDEAENKFDCSTSDGSTLSISISVTSSDPPLSESEDCTEAG